MSKQDWNTDSAAAARYHIENALNALFADGGDEAMAIYEAISDAINGSNTRLVAEAVEGRNGSTVHDVYAHSAL